MEQKPIRASGPLEPPTPDIAQAYLDEAVAVERRRDDRIDRRAIGWLNIVNAVAIAAFLTLYVVAIREKTQTVSSLLLIAFLMWGQIATGLTVRSGLQWRLVGRRWLSVLGLVLFGLILVPLFWMAAFADDDTAARLLPLPGAFALVVLGALGCRQLWQARGRRPEHARDVPSLSSAERAGTAAIGVLLGGVTALLAFDGVLTAVLILLVLLVLIAWMFVGRSGLGLPALGEHWRWPQFTAFALSVVVLAAACALTLFTTLMSPGVAGLSGAAILLLMIAASLLGGRDDD